MYPFVKCVTVGQHEDLSTVVTLAASGLPDGKQKPILCADSYYLDNEGRLNLIALDCKYCMALNPCRFPHLVRPLKAKVENPGERAGMYNPNTGELLVHFWDPRPIVGRKFVLCRGMKRTSGKMVAGEIPGYDEYSILFRACDMMNKAMAGLYWPHKRRGRTGGTDADVLNVDDFILTAVLMNAYHMFLEVNPENIDPLAIYKRLGEQMTSLAFTLFEWAMQSDGPEAIRSVHVETEDDDQPISLESGGSTTDTEDEESTECPSGSVRLIPRTNAEDPSVKSPSVHSERESPVFVGKRPSGSCVGTGTFDKRIPAGGKGKDRMQYPCDSDLREEELSQHLRAHSVVGRRIKVWWPRYRAWYPGTVVRYSPARQQFEVNYDDYHVDTVWEALFGERSCKWSFIDDTAGNE